MKLPNIALIVFSFALAGCGTLQGIRGFEYRGAHWGMTQKELTQIHPALEHSAEAAEANYLFETPLEIAGYKAAAGYYFPDGRLTTIFIIFEESPVAQYPVQFTKMKELLTEKYGKPASDGDQVVAMRRYLNRQNPGQYPPFSGLVPTSWKIGQTEILLSCGGNCSGSKNETVVITYQDKSGATKGL